MSGKTKIFALLLLGIGLIFMVMAFLSGQNVRKGGEAIKTEIERFPVVVSAVEIQFGKPVTPEMLKVEKFAIAPSGAFTDIGDVIGKKPLFNIGKGLPVTNQYFESGAVAAEVREGYRAFALRLDENNVATAKIKAGDYVDVFSIFKSNTRDIEETISRLIMPKLRVLSVGAQLVNAPETANAANEKDVNNRQVRLKAMMVEVPTGDVNTLAIAQTEGELFVVLRGPEEEELPDMSKYPQPDTVLKPSLVKGEDGKVLKVQPPVELTASDKAFAGISLNNAMLPGSGNSKDNKKTPQTGQRSAPQPATVEIIRGGESTRETAR
ncbi:Flp pilus assembly protein CpaB [Limnobacter parvus]|uniref:Flp pilus assembly protein CpaB n=1 Tax=Limnobacter parvus TaxID=2939690 RepID=A0ABT1XGD6_9BURK|nr:Flp pilus assembly protein CpaB [Limnobacter parvus]MCR2745638.1 Flp pilus assembly protein CpaB [Limnobacter parvus]